MKPYQRSTHTTSATSPSQSQTLLPTTSSLTPTSPSTPSLLILRRYKPFPTKLPHLSFPYYVISLLVPFMLLLLLLSFSSFYTFLQPTVSPCDLVLSKQLLHQSPPSKIPHIIHHQSFTLHPDRTPSHTSWLSTFPPPSYTHKYWDDALALKLITEKYSWFLPAFKGYEAEIMRIDAARYFILYEYGGVYKDMDVEILLDHSSLSAISTRFFSLLPPESVGVIESPYKYNEEMQNSLMSSPVKHAFWKTYLFPLLLERASKHGKGVLWRTGPKLLSDAFAAAKEDEAGKADGAEILPCQLFQRVPRGDDSEISMLNWLGKEVLTRIIPMKYCGDFAMVDDCQVTKHHGVGSWAVGNQQW